MISRWRDCDGVRVRERKKEREIIDRERERERERENVRRQLFVIVEYQ